MSKLSTRGAEPFEAVVLVAPKAPVRAQRRRAPDARSVVKIVFTAAPNAALHGTMQHMLSCWFQYVALEIQAWGSPHRSEPQPSRVMLQGSGEQSVSRTAPPQLEGGMNALMPTYALTLAKLGGQTARFGPKPCSSPPRNPCCISQKSENR